MAIYAVFHFLFHTPLACIFRSTFPEVGHLFLSSLVINFHLLGPWTHSDLKWTQQQKQTNCRCKAMLKRAEKKARGAGTVGKLRQISQMKTRYPKKCHNSKGLTSKQCTFAVATSEHTQAACGRRRVGLSRPVNCWINRAGHRAAV